MQTAYRRRVLAILVGAATLMASAGLLAPVTSAAVPLGGGAAIVVDGSYCTLTTIGRDNTGELVGFTAAHCGGPGAQVVAEGTNDPVGSVVAANGDLDYAVIKFDAGKVTPTANFAGFTINGIGPTPRFYSRSVHRAAPLAMAVVRSPHLRPSGPRRWSPRSRRGNQVITGRRSPLTANSSA